VNGNSPFNWCGVGREGALNTGVPRCTSDGVAGWMLVLFG